MWYPIWTVVVLFGEWRLSYRCAICGCSSIYSVLTCCVECEGRKLIRERKRPKRKYWKLFGCTVWIEFLGYEFAHDSFESSARILAGTLFAAEHRRRDLDV